MNVLVYLLPVALLLGAAGLVAFVWALKNGQYEDMDGAAERILIEPAGSQAAVHAPSSRPGEALPPGAETSRAVLHSAIEACDRDPMHHLDPGR
jgi:cbb3-type cytochrome oxidase maturation protein